MTRSIRWIRLASVLGLVIAIQGQARAGFLALFDAAGAHPLGSGVRSASVAFGPTGEVLLVTLDSGVLTQFDAFGSRTLGSGVLSADVSFGPAGEVVLVTSDGGVLTRFDATGSRTLGIGVQF